MGGIEDNVATIGDWVPPSPGPSPRTFFSALLSSDAFPSRMINPAPVPPRDVTNTAPPSLFLGSHDSSHHILKYAGGPHLSESPSFSDQKPGSRGGLVERMAARAGFNAPRLNTESIRPSDLSCNPEVRSPYLTIPPGLSPTTLLESPVFLSNSLAHPSPTTGKFSFLPSVDSTSVASAADQPDKIKDAFFEDMDTSSFAFKPMAESGSSSFLGSMSKMAPSTLPPQSSPGIEVSIRSDNSFQTRDVEATKVQPQNRNTLGFPADFSGSAAEKQKDHGSNSMATDLTAFNAVGTSAEHSPPPDDQADDEADQGASGDSMVAGTGGTPSEDGYNWRKYGQKTVKGSEYPRSYYKCTHPNCPVKKKVERSHEGHITEIIYKGAHNHPKPPPNRRAAIGLANPLMDMQVDLPEQAGLQSVANNDLIWASTQKGTIGNPNWRQDCVEVTSSASVAPEFGNLSSTEQVRNGSHFESGDAVDASSTFSNDEEEDDRATHGSVGYDGEEDESESKRRKLDAYTAEMGGATRAIREPRVVVQTTSEVDILDDGYRWRKYGQKVVKGNPNPRSYYKCTSAGCTVRKHVERASHDLKSVITTYEGKHNHDVPAARNSSHVNSGSNGSVPSQVAQNHLHRPETSQVHNSMARFDRSTASFGAFGLPARPHLGPSLSFNFGMNQPNLANLVMAGLGPGQPKMPMMPVHPFLPQQRPVNEMGFMLPKGEPKVEPVSEPVHDLSANSSAYQQIMGRLPLGPQM